MVVASPGRLGVPPPCPRCLPGVPSHLRGEGATGWPTEDLLYQFYQPTAPTAASLDRDAAVVVDFLCHAMARGPPLRGASILSVVDERRKLNWTE